VLFVACRKHKCTCTGYTVDKNPCGCVIFRAKIGNDFDSALDSLKRQYEPQLVELEATGYYSGKGYFIEKERINVDFIYDDRVFFYLIFKDSVITYRHLIRNFDVLDEKGNYYRFDVNFER
jgi:hypothetical protein